MEEGIELTKREEEQVWMLAMMHFSRMRDVVGRRSVRGVGRAIKALRCEECQDYIMKQCEGEGLSGWECMSCMYRKIGSTDDWGQIGE